MQLVQAEKAHAGLLAELHGACFEEGWSETDFSDLLEMQGLSGFIFLRDESFSSAVGFVLISGVLDEAEIVTIGVLPQHRKHGWGSLILGAALAKRHAWGTRRVYLEVEEQNFAAQSLYRRFGFDVCGRRKNYYKAAEGLRDAVVMSLDMSEDPPFAETALIESRKDDKLQGNPL